MTIPPEDPYVREDAESFRPGGGCLRGAGFVVLFFALGTLVLVGIVLYTCRIG